MAINKPSFTVPAGNLRLCVYNTDSLNLHEVAVTLERRRPESEHSWYPTATLRADELQTIIAALGDAAQGLQRAQATSKSVHATDANEEADSDTTSAATAINDTSPPAGDDTTPRDPRINALSVAKSPAERPSKPPGGVRKPEPPASKRKGVDSRTGRSSRNTTPSSPVKKANTRPLGVRSASGRTRSR